MNGMKISLVALIIVVILYIGIAILGLMAFRSDIMGSIINNLAM